MDVKKLKERLEKDLSGKRFRHTLGVSQTAGQLARRYGYSDKKAEIAGLLHDCARDVTEVELLAFAERNGFVLTNLERYTPILLHSFVGAVLAETKYKIDDPEILRAIRLHTTGGSGMALLDKILYLADGIEPGRKYPEVDDLRRVAEEDLDRAVLRALNQSMAYMMERGHVIHPDTAIARNEFLLKGSAAHA